MSYENKPRYSRGGKSTLANVISNSKNYDVSHRSVSSTKDTNIHNYTVDGKVYKIVDTVGIGDTKMSPKEVVSKLVMAAEAIKYGINQVLFVTSGRFTNVEIENFETLQSVAFDKSIFEYTTIVRTSFPDFEDDAECENDYQDMISENNNLSQLVKSCKKVIYVDNPPITFRTKQGVEETRKESRKRLLAYLSTCTKVYMSEKLQDIVDKKINGYMTLKEKLQNDINDLRQKLDETSELGDEQRQAASKKQRELEEQPKSHFSIKKHTSHKLLYRTTFHVPGKHQVKLVAQLLKLC
nr:3354_t:CDS:2 [Entrophospora candida]